MRFEIRPGLVVFHDEQPGEHATMFGPHGQKFIFRPDASHFSDSAKKYAWAFEGHLEHGDRVVFATSDREIVGRLDDDEIKLDIPEGSVVAYDKARKPLIATDNPIRTIEELLSPPYPRSKPRPIPIIRRY